MMRCAIALAIVVALAVSGVAVAAEPVVDMAAASKAFLDSLSPELRKAAVYDFNSDERLNWHYVPKDRNGVSFAMLSPEQRALGMGVLQSGLSQEGVDKVDSIRSLEIVLHEMEGSATRDPDKYFFTFFGEPAPDGTWAFRYEGHHLSLHWTAVNGKIVATYPQFMGANPAEVRQGSMQGKRALAQEEDMARELVKSLDEKQRGAGVTSPAAPPEILTGAQREAEIQADTGIAYSELNAEQQGLLIGLIQVYAHTMRPELAEDRLAKVRGDGLESVKFAWMGGLDKGEKHYYRIQGKSFLIEYDNTQNDANHIHTVWRDFAGDFGMDVLKEHYKQHADPAHLGEHAH